MVTELLCPDCGHATELTGPVDELPDNLRCPACGAALAVTGHETVVANTLAIDAGNSNGAPPVEVTAVGNLLISGTLALEAPFPLRKARTVVGREGADLTLDDPALSEQHFEIEIRDDEFFIRDLDSTNGTKVNGERVRATQLQSEDRIEAGQITFVFKTLPTIRWNDAD